MEYLHPENYIQMNFIQMHLNENMLTGERLHLH